MMLLQKFFFLSLICTGLVLADPEEVRGTEESPHPDETVAPEIAVDGGITTEETFVTPEGEIVSPTKVEKKEENTDSKETKLEEKKVQTPAADLGKLAELLNIETTAAGETLEAVTSGSNEETKEKPSKSSEPEKKTDTSVEQKDDIKIIQKTPSVESSSDNTGTQPKVQVVDVSVGSADNAEIKPKAADISVQAVPVDLADKAEMKIKKDNDVKIVDLELVTSTTSSSGQRVELPDHVGYVPGLPKQPADHKMTALEQNAYICNLPKLEDDLCPMTINLEENVGISDPGANAFCNDVIAAPMGYKGFCVALMKTNPETGAAIYTRTCAYYDKEKDKSKCGTYFLTTVPQTNVSQIRFSCENNGIMGYIPTSCVKRAHEIRI